MRLCAVTCRAEMSRRARARARNRNRNTRREKSRTNLVNLEKAVSYQPRRGGVAGHGLTQIRLFTLRVNATSPVVAT